jgi:hypothetical protein
LAKKQKLTPIPAELDIWGITGYEPSPQASAFHDSEARFRFLLWGIKGGKTYAGAHDFLASVLTKAQNPGDRKHKLLCWIVAPTYHHLDTCQREMDQLFSILEDAGYPLVARYWTRARKWVLIDGTEIQCRSGEIPENLRGPNVDMCWMDEGAYVKELSWIQVKQRISARRGDVIVTTTPDGRNWVWRECVEAGMPGDGPYGAFDDGKGRRWVSHYRTQDFPWVPEEEVLDAKKTMPAIEFERDYLAAFLSGGKSVFRYIEETFHTTPLPKKNPPNDVRFVIGVDLAKQQDWSVLTVMSGDGMVWDIQRWTGIDYKVQKDRIRDAAAHWNDAICIVDTANVGNSISDDLRGMGVHIHRVDMHNGAIKRDIVEALQAVFDQKGGGIQIPDPRAPFSPSSVKVLVEELKAYEASITSGGRITYSAPKGMHDDCLISLALAFWGKKNGLAGGSASAATVALGREEFMRSFDRSVREMPSRSMRAAKSRLYGKRGVLGLSLGKLWK